MKTTAPLVDALMSPDVRRVRADAPAEAAWLTMQQGGFHHLVVVEGTELVGVVSARDLGDERGAERRRHRLVRDLMSSPVETIEPSATAAEAAARLRGRGLGSLVVLRDGVVCGILTVNDLLGVLERMGAADAPGGAR